MDGTGKLLHGCSNVFVLYPMIIYVVSTTLLLVAEGAQAPPSQSDIKEAETIVGRFLRNESGTTWLSGLAKTRSAPLTTQDLMTEIIAATRPGGKVWEAASILSESLKDQSLKGINAGSVLGQAENWKDLISHIEDQDDIICLYRKNTEETAKKADDWKKFLRTVSPGYTVHLAIDTGRKYVICLKKIDVIETTPEKNFTTPGSLSTEASFSNSSRVSAEMTFPRSSGIRKMIPASGIPKYSNNTESNAMPVESDENCDDEDSEGRKNNGDHDSNNDDGINDSNFGGKHHRDAPKNEYHSQKLRRGMDLNPGFEDFQRNTGQDYRRPVPPSIDRREFHLGNNWQPLVTSPLRTPGRVDPTTSQDHECNRPIILVMQNGNTPMASPWLPPNAVPFHRMPPPKLSIIPRYPMHPPRMSGPSFNPVRLPNKVPQTTKPNLGRPIVDVKSNKPGPRPIFSQDTYFIDKTPRGKMQRPVPKVRTPIAQPTARNRAKPIEQRTWKASVPQPLGERSRRPERVQQKPDVIDDQRYPFGNYMPRNMEGLQVPRITDSLIRRPPETTRWNLPPKHTVHPQRRIPDEANLFDYNHPSDKTRNSYRLPEILQNDGSPHLPPQAPGFGSRPQPVGRNQAQLLTGHPLSPLINIRTPSKSTAIIDRELLRQPSSPHFQGIDRINGQRPNFVRQNPPAPKFDQESYLILDPNYPIINNFIRPNPLTSTRLPLFTRPCPIPWNMLYAINNNNPNAINSLGHPLARWPCPCNRPVKLKILINGKVQEPLEVSVISEPGQRIEVVGSDYPVMSYGSRAMKEGVPLTGDLENEEENILSADAQVRERMKQLAEYNEGAVYDNQAEKQGEEKETKEEVASVENRQLKAEHNSTTEPREQMTTDMPRTESSQGSEVGERILHEAMTKTSSGDSTTEANTTVSAITNSTIVE